MTKAPCSCAHGWAVHADCSQGTLKMLPAQENNEVAIFDHLKTEGCADGNQKPKKASLTVIVFSFIYRCQCEETCARIVQKSDYLLEDSRSSILIRSNHTVSYNKYVMPQDSISHLSS